ncbi:hypothetical protein L7F22_069014 [Adiantum nelumboides]|nr:hypothetical protein [Adiantum nelumboides]
MSSDSPAKDLDAVTQRINSMMSKNGAENGAAADKVEEKDVKEKAGSSDLRESSYEVKVTLADQQADPNSPLYSATSFEDLGLHEDLLKASTR